MRIRGLLKAVFAAIFSRAVFGSQTGFLPSTLDEIHREPAQARLLIFGLHVGARLAHGGDDAVQRHAMAAVAVQRERCRGDRLDRAEGVALDARDLDQPADRIAGHAEVMLHRDLGGVLDLVVRAPERGA